MSELTTRFIDDTYAEYYNTGKHELAQIYLKSEADKVIAEKDAELRRQKYKRCLAMAKRCGDAYDKWMMKKANAIALSKDGIKYYHQARWKVSHYMRWQKRWLELAEQFKDKEADDV